MAPRHSGRPPNSPPAAGIEGQPEPLDVFSVQPIRPSAGKVSMMREATSVMRSVTISSPIATITPPPTS